MPTVNGVMLAVHCKRTDQVDLVTPISKYIKTVYSDRDATESAEDLTRVSALRSELVTAQSGSQVSLKDTILKYYKSLMPIETRFPISRDKSTVQISFPWYDAFRPQKKTWQYNIHFEKASIMFNLGAVCSQQALAADRNTPEGLKAACIAFQEAAGAFALLKEVAARIDSPRPVDLSAECIAMLEKLMLAQAQECAYSNAVLGGKSPSVLARLAKQAAVMYDEVQGSFAVPALQQHFDRSWVTHLAMKASLYEVEALMQVGRGMHAQDKVAHEIATLQEAFKLLQVTKKHAKVMGKDMEDSVRLLQDTLQTTLARAERDNASIYLERVPAFTDLPSVQGALLVKAAPPQILEASAEQLFTGLVPDHSAKALSRYTDMVDALVRAQLTKLEQATDNARLRLREWELPDTVQALDVRSTAALPDALAAELQEVVTMGGVSHLKGILGEIGEIRRAVDADLAECESVLNEEARADGDMRGRFGDKWTPGASAGLAKHFWDKIASYRSTMKQAGDSDANIVQRLNEREAAFAALTPEGAVQQLPRLQAPLVALGPHDPAVVVASLRRNLEALQQAAAERGAIEEALKEAKQKDNVLPKLMSCPNPDALFTQEIKKYDTLVTDTAANVSKSEELLAAIGQDNQRFRTIFEVPAWRAACESAAGAVKAQMRALKELLDHLSEGLRFYTSLQETVKTHVQLCTDFACTRKIERDELAQELERKRKEEADKESQRLAAMHIQSQQAQPPQGVYPQPPPSNVYSYPPAGGAPPHHGGYAPPGAPPTPQPPQHAVPHYGYQQQPPPQQPGAPPPAYAPPPAGGYPPQQQGYPHPQYQTYGSQAPPPQQYQGQYQPQQGYQQPYGQYQQQPPPQQAPPPPQQQPSGYHPYQAPPPPHNTQYTLNPYGPPRP